MWHFGRLEFIYFHIKNKLDTKGFLQIESIWI